MAETQTERAQVDRIGNALVASTLLVLGGMLVAHALGAPFIGFLAAIALVVLGFLMSRGSFGDNGTMAVLMMVLGPAAIIVPPFFPALLLAGPIIGAFFIVAGIAKFPGLW